MARRRGEWDVGKEHFWRRVLQKWRRSGQSIRDFCADNELAEPSFYAWRRTLAERDQQARPTGQDLNGADAGGINAGLPMFVPVQVTDSTTAAASATLEVVVGQAGRSRVVRVSPGFDALTLRRLLTVLEDAILANDAAAQGRPSC